MYICMSVKRINWLFAAKPLDFNSGVILKKFPWKNLKIDQLTIFTVFKHHKHLHHTLKLAFPEGTHNAHHIACKSVKRSQHKFIRVKVVDDSQRPLNQAWAQYL